MNRYKRLLTNTAVFTVGKFVSKLLVFFMMRLYTGCLSPAEFSQADLIVNLANLLIPIACLGISEGIFRNAAARTGDKEAFFTNGLFVLLVGSVVFGAISPLIGLVPSFESTAWLVSVYVIVSNFHSVVSQYLCAVGRTRLFAGQGILNTALTVGFNILFLPVLDAGVNGFVLSIILADFLTTVFLVCKTRLWRAVRPKKVSKSIIHSMLAFSLPLVPTTIFWWITSVSDRYMVTYFCSPEENGLYAAAYKIPTLLIYVVGIFDSAWKLSASYEADDKSVCMDLYAHVWRVYMTVAFLGGGVLILSGKLFSRILFAESFRDAWIYIPLLTMAAVFHAFDTFLGSVYYTCRKTFWSMLTSFFGASLNLLLNFLWIPRYGAMGASLATFLSYFFVCLVRLSTVRRLIPFRQEIPRGMVNTVLMGGLAFSVMLTVAPKVRPAWMWSLSGLLLLVLFILNIRPVAEVLKGFRHLAGKE